MSGNVFPLYLRCFLENGCLPVSIDSDIRYMAVLDFLKTLCSEKKYSIRLAPSHAVAGYVKILLESSEKFFGFALLWLSNLRPELYTS